MLSEIRCMYLLHLYMSTIDCNLCTRMTMCLVVYVSLHVCVCLFVLSSLNSSLTQSMTVTTTMYFNQPSSMRDFLDPYHVIMDHGFSR